MTNFARDCRVLRNVRVPMRDGVTLAATVYLPLGEGPWPTILVRTAYNRVPIIGSGYAQQGLAFVSQDVRGRYDSQGAWYPFTAEEADGFDTLEWLVGQPWCNGHVGMFGDSYLAATQFYAALSGHPALAALNPCFMAGDCWKRAYYCDGAFSLGLTWSWLCFETCARTSEAALMPCFDVKGILQSLPLLTMDEASGAPPVPSYRDYVTHAQYDALWDVLNVRQHFGQVRAPMLLTGGWYDYYAGETFLNYLALCEHAPTRELRDSHRVVVGPWTHGVNPSTVLGEVDFGPEALREDGHTERWLLGLLSGESPPDILPAPLRLFVMGANEWRDEQEWPLARTRYTEYYLHAGGGLSPTPPGDEAPDRYTYDPANPVPTRGGNHSIGPYNPGLYELAPPGPYDQRGIEARDDVLVFTSDELSADLEATGPVTVTLYASSSSPDTDFVARLCDVHPDGRSINITEGVIRARFRGGVWSPPQPLEPGQVCEFVIDLQATSNVFRRGHRLRLDVTSSCFPLWDRNLNTGEDPGTATRMEVACQTIHHGRTRPSRLTLPVIPARG